MTNFQNFQNSFSGLHTLGGLQALDTTFLRTLPESLCRRLITARNAPENVGAREYSALVIALSPFVDDFLRDCFDLKSTRQTGHTSRNEIFACRQKFIQRVVKRDPRYHTPHAINIDTIKAKTVSLCGGNISDISFARAVFRALDDAHPETIDVLIQYAIWALHTHDDQSVLFSQDPKTLESYSYVDGIFESRSPAYRHDFAFYDEKPSSAEIDLHENQCLICHDRAKDTCRTGTNHPNADGVPMHGCPLDQKISEMIHIHREGYTIGALATIVIDNPLVAATGRRICNDCMSSCILHKSAPVDVPSIETHILDTVLGYEYGFEIYALLTRWNPLNIQNPLPDAPTGHTVCVAGQGPAGFGLAFELLRRGHSILAVDTLTIQPIDNHHIIHPIAHVSDLWKSLDARIPDGFGGVAEYGITSRWDKNYLYLIRILLERFKTYHLMSGLRLGSQVQISNLSEKGISHLAMCVGTGRPNDLAQLRTVNYGVHIASDFLMHLNLGAYHKNLTSKIWIDLPLVVVGGGLTACDAATEALVYYKRQREKFNASWKKLPAHKQKELLTGNERLQRIVRQIENGYLDNPENVTLIYRGKITDSPAYQTNKHEIFHALDQGVRIIEDAIIDRAHTDERGHITGLTIHQTDGQQQKVLELPASTVLIATGIRPNTHISGDINVATSADTNFIPVDESSFFVRGDPLHVLTISHHGDLHPDYSGSVVKALASGKKGAQEIDTTLREKSPIEHSVSEIKSFYTSTLSMIRMHALGTLITLRAPACVAHYKPGNFFKLTIMGKAIALLPIKVARTRNELTFLIHGINSDFSDLSINQKMTLMGPVGNMLSLKDDTYFYTQPTWLLSIANIASFGVNSTVCLNEDIPDDLKGLLRELHPSVRIIHQAPDDHNNDFPAISSTPHNAPKDAEVLTLAPMQCMMKSVCGRCRVATKGAPIFACENLWNPHATIDWEIGSYADDPQNPWHLVGN